jgi:hypothetical protein
LDYCYEKWREIVWLDWEGVGFVRLGVDFVGLQKGREIEKSTKNGNQRNKANPSKYLEKIH